MATSSSSSCAHSHHPHLSPLEALSVGYSALRQIHTHLQQPAQGRTGDRLGDLMVTRLGGLRPVVLASLCALHATSCHPPNSAACLRTDLDPFVDALVHKLGSLLDGVHEWAVSRLPVTPPVDPPLRSFYLGAQAPGKLNRGSFPQYSQMMQFVETEAHKLLRMDLLGRWILLLEKLSECHKLLQAIHQSMSAIKDCLGHGTDSRHEEALMVLSQCEPILEQARHTRWHAAFSNQALSNFLTIFLDGPLCDMKQAIPKFRAFCHAVFPSASALQGQGSTLEKEYWCLIGSLNSLEGVKTTLEASVSSLQQCLGIQDSGADITEEKPIDKALATLDPKTVINNPRSLQDVVSRLRALRDELLESEPAGDSPLFESLEQPGELFSTLDFPLSFDCRAQHLMLIADTITDRHRISTAEILDAVSNIRDVSPSDAERVAVFLDELLNNLVDFLLMNRDPGFVESSLPESLENAREESIRVTRTRKRSVADITGVPESKSNGIPPTPYEDASPRTPGTTKVAEHNPAIAFSLAEEQPARKRVVVDAPRPATTPETDRPVTAPERSGSPPPKPSRSSSSSSYSVSSMDVTCPEVDPSEMMLTDRVLGRGGFGKVVVGRWCGNEVAVKIPFDKQVVSEIQKEAQMLISCRHPNIVPFWGIYTDPDTPGLVFPLYCGSLDGFLSAKRAKNHRLPLLPALRIAMGIANGLKFLHSKGIMHRDLKPGNILLDERQTPLITDFGLSRFLPEEASERLSVVGTPVYMAPEVVDEKYSFSADVYSFGIILWEMISGKRAFSEFTNYFQINYAVKVRHCRPAVEDCDLAPVSLHQLMEECWHQDADARPTMGVVLKRLNEIFCEEEEKQQIETRLLSESVSIDGLSTCTFVSFPNKLAEAEASLEGVPEHDIPPVKPAPEGIPKDAWLAMYTRRAFLATRDLYRLFHCTEESCPTMTAGPGVLYLWADGVKYKTPVEVSAPVYASLLEGWVSRTVEDDSFGDPPYGDRFHSSVRNIFRRLFRVYAHVYRCHFDQLESNPNLLESFMFKLRGFMAVVLQYQLIPNARDLSPLQTLLTDLHLN